MIDLIASQVHGKEVQEICVKSLENPMKVLAKILKNSGMEPPEPRLLFQTGIGASNPNNFLIHINSTMYCNLNTSMGDKYLLSTTLGANPVKQRTLNQ